ncbi:hypothetical protein LCGC14_0174670 [marine sediment metagenome]|uniref:Uncharacterized protein n=1 Tax=marine sediment metagenome TaxID=412755 RepID=A0A0F9XTH1_9ZZZZ
MTVRIINSDRNLKSRIITLLRNENNKGLKRSEIHDHLDNKRSSTVFDMVGSMELHGDLEKIGKLYYLKGTIKKHREKRINSLRQQITDFLETADEEGYTPNEVTEYLSDKYTPSSTRSALGHMKSLGQVDQDKGKYFLVKY